MIALDRKEMLDFWGADEIYTYRQEDLCNTFLSSENISILSNFGLPSWAAPNINFHSRAITIGRDFVVIGEDREDCPLVIVRNKCYIFKFVEGDGIKIMLMASNIERLILILISYARMVDAALEINGNDAFIFNNIPEYLIDKFFNVLKEIDPESSLQGGFWVDEIARLYGHMLDDGTFQKR